jgi:hypothetical protein
MSKSLQMEIIRGALQFLNEQMDSDTLREYTGVEVRKFINRKLDHLSRIFGNDPRNMIVPEELLVMFAKQHNMSQSGTYLLKPGDIDDFCQEVFMKALEMGIVKKAKLHSV